MNTEETKIIERFVKNARPADRVPFIMQQEIIDLLTEIRDELVTKTVKPAGRPKKTD
jgi:hypothetical protein